MAEQRLPTVDSDDGQWGDILNQFIAKEHYNTGINDSNNGSHKAITIRPGSQLAGTAPLKFTSGTLLTTPEAGAVEFNDDNLYLTQTTGNIRKKIAAYDDSVGATGDMYYRDSNGNFIRMPVGSDGQILTINNNTPNWSTIIDGAKKITISTTQPSSPTIGDIWINSN